MGKDAKEFLSIFPDLNSWKSAANIYCFVVKRLKVILQPVGNCGLLVRISERIFLAGLSVRKSKALKRALL